MTEEMKQGIFLTLDEFKNNLPSVTSFTTRKLRKTNLSELVDKSGNVILHYFACYDGTTLRKGKPLSSLSKMLSPKYDVMYRVGNSFQLYDDHIANSSSQTTINNINGHPANIPIYLPATFNIRVPRQLDLETGELY